MPRKKVRKKISPSPVLPDFNPNDFVFAKLRGYPSWPARIESDSKSHRKIPNTCKYVFFFGTNDYGIVRIANISKYGELKDTLVIGKENSKFERAQKDIEVAMIKARAKRTNQMNRRVRAHGIQDSLKPEDEEGPKKLCGHAHHKDVHYTEEEASLRRESLDTERCICCHITRLEQTVPPPAQAVQVVQVAPNQVNMAIVAPNQVNMAVVAPNQVNMAIVAPNQDNPQPSCSRAVDVVPVEEAVASNEVYDNSQSSCSKALDVVPFEKTLSSNKEIQKGISVSYGYAMKKANLRRKIVKPRPRRVNIPLAVATRRFGKRNCVFVHRDKTNKDTIQRKLARKSGITDCACLHLAKNYRAIERFSLQLALFPSTNVNLQEELNRNGVSEDCTNEEPNDGPIEVTIDHPNDGPIEVTIDHPTEDTIDDPTEDIIDHPTEDIIDHPTEDIIDHPTEDTIDHPTEDTIDHPTEDTIDNNIGCTNKQPFITESIGTDESMSIKQSLASLEPGEMEELISDVDPLQVEEPEILGEKTENGVQCVHECVIGSVISDANITDCDVKNSGEVIELDCNTYYDGIMEDIFPDILDQAVNGKYDSDEPVLDDIFAAEEIVTTSENNRDTNENDSVTAQSDKIAIKINDVVDNDATILDKDDNAMANNSSTTTDITIDIPIEKSSGTEENNDIELGSCVTIKTKLERKRSHDGSHKTEDDEQKKKNKDRHHRKHDEKEPELKKKKKCHKHHDAKASSKEEKQVLVLYSGQTHAATASEECFKEFQFGELLQHTSSKKKEGAANEKDKRRNESTKDVSAHGKRHNPKEDGHKHTMSIKTVKISNPKDDAKKKLSEDMKKSAPKDTFKKAASDQFKKKISKTEGGRFSGHANKHAANADDVSTSHVKKSKPTSQIKDVESKKKMKSKELDAEGSTHTKKTDEQEESMNSRALQSMCSSRWAYNQMMSTERKKKEMLQRKAERREKLKQLAIAKQKSAFDKSTEDSVLEKEVSLNKPSANSNIKNNRQSTISCTITSQQQQQPINESSSGLEDTNGSQPTEQVRIIHSAVNHPSGELFAPDILIQTFVPFRNGIPQWGLAQRSSAAGAIQPVPTGPQSKTMPKTVSQVTGVAKEGTKKKCPDEKPKVTKKEISQKKPEMTKDEKKVKKK